jgi:enterochelin esterase family protein
MKMKNMKYLYIILILIAPVLSAQSQFQQFINYVNSLPDPSAKTAAVDSFMVYARTVGIPFIEDSTANFIYRGSAASSSIAGDFNDWSPSSWPMTNLSQTNFWYRSVIFELDARLDYKFVLNGGTWILDPENPRTCEGGYGPNSELAMPLYVQPWEIVYRPSVQQGIVLNRTIYSPTVGSNYQLNIYLPPGYDSLSAQTYPAVYFQDGTEYINLGKAVNVLNNLIDSGKIQPVIAVFVKPNNRNEEYAGSLRNQYRLFFVNELVPYMDSEYKTRQAANQRLVLGDSFGGNISALISYNHPEVFGLCGLHSAAFWPNNYEAYSLILSGPVKNIAWNAIWGTYEPLYPNMRAFRDSLISYGYNIEWLERPEGHSWGLWRASVDRILEYFFPGNPVGVADDSKLQPVQFYLSQNYPNPFNPSTRIIYSVPASSSVLIKVYDILGNEINTLVDEEQPAGEYEVTWSPENITSGIYFYTIQSGIYTAARKMIFIK